MTKKRNLLKLAVCKMIQEAVTFVEDTPDMATKLELIKTLRNVTEGKIYVENERARLTLKLSNIHEATGDVTSASSVLQELQVVIKGFTPELYYTLGQKFDLIILEPFRSIPICDPLSLELNLRSSS